MDKKLAEFLAHMEHDTHPNESDWEEILKTGEDAGDVKVVLAALKQLPYHSLRVSLENVLLSAVCLGNGEAAIVASQHLKRELSQDEKILLLETIITSGNVSGFCERIAIGDVEGLSFLHTTMTVGLCRILHHRRRGASPQVELNSWLKTYYEELVTFELSGTIFESHFFPKGFFVLLPENMVERIVGGLLAHEVITRDQARFIRSFKLEEDPS